jgi:hypothetical protein
VRRRRTEEGIALVAVLVVSTLVATVAVGVSLLIGIDHLALGHHRDATSLRYAAEGALELAALALARTPDWDEALGGRFQAGLADGPPMGTRTVDGATTIDLAVQTHLLNCGRPAPCTASQMEASTSERPWGRDNPHWRPFLYGSLSSLAPFRHAPRAYVVVWVADDGRETDGDPGHDAPNPTDPGHGILRVRADAFGRGGARRSIEAEVARACRTVVGAESCLPNVRVQSWRDVRQSIP